MAAEVETPARTDAAELGLPVIHRLPIDGGAEPERVGARELGDVGGRRVRRIVPRVRIPAVRGTLRAHAVPPIRHAALPDVWTVGAGNAEREAVVGAVVRAVPPLVEERVADGRVDDERSARREALADRGDPRLRLPAAAGIERKLPQVGGRTRT